MARRRGWGEWARGAEAVVALAGAALLIRFLPARYALRTGAIGHGEREGAETARPVVRAVVAAARRVPWRTVCFQQGLAAQWMLRRRGVAARLRYGARTEPGKGLAAHVWVSVGDQVVIGGDETLSRFALLMTVPGERA